MSAFSKIVKDIDNKKLSPVYLLDGEEAFYIDRLLEKLENLVPEEQRDFGLVTFYGKDTHWQEVVNAARQFPMFGERIVVILREAGKMKGLKELAGYVADPQSSTVLVIEHRFKKINGRLKLPKLAKKNGIYFTSNKIREWEVPGWIVEYCAAHKSKIGQGEAQTIAAYLGEDLQSIANELEKIWINDKDNKNITPEKIEKHIGINRDFNVLDLPKVLLGQKQERLANMMNYFEANPKKAPMPPLIGSFCYFLQKVNLAQSTGSNYTKDRQLGIWKNHRQIANRYSKEQIHQCIALLEVFSRKAVGIDAISDEGLLREMTGKMQALLR